ncbi:MAG: type II toxin-antitoxin system RelE/ParE family toxin [Patescibacteria group bacterium]
MVYQISVKPNAQKELKKLPKKDYYRVLAAFVVLSANPFVGKKMKGEFTGQYNYRVWPYRIVYEIYNEKLMILVITIGHRQGVYK